MKKIPMFLAMLILIASSINLKDCRAEGVISGWQGENVLPDFLDISMLSLRKRNGAGSAVYYAGKPQNESENVLRMYFLMYDYKHGVTEEEADQLVREFRGEQEEWVADMVKYESVMDLASFSGVAGFEDNDAMTELNRAGILYYVLELGTQAQHEAGTTNWVQGKLNYRGCLHDFWGLEEPRAAACTVQETGGGRIRFENSTVVESDGIPTRDEELVSWSEEWGEVLLAEIRELDQEFEGIVDEVGSSDLEKSEQVNVIKARLEEMAGFAHKSMQGTEIKDKIAVLQGKIAQWEQPKAPTPVTPSRPVHSGTVTVAEDDASNDVADELGVPEVTAEHIQSNVGMSSKEENGAESGVDEEDEEKAEISQGEMLSQENEEAIEVPDLGREEGKTWSIWPLILIGLSILGIAIWCGKKWRERQR